jgi:hypothetical protein
VPYRDALDSSNGWIRKGAVESCLSPTIVEQWLRGTQQSFDRLTLMPPILVNLALTDPSLVVRHQAIENLNGLFRHSPGFPSKGLDLLDTRELSNWWGHNKSHYKELLLLSIANTPPSDTSLYYGLNTIRLYDEVRKVEMTAAPSLQKDLKSALERLRSIAIQHNSDSPETLAKNVIQRNCSDVEKDFSIRLNSSEWSAKTELIQSSIPNYGMWELEFVKTCESNAQLLKQISTVMVQTHLMDRRYGATTVVNKWTGSNLDPFDTKAIQDWWEHNKSVAGN